MKPEGEESDVVYQIRSFWNSNCNRISKQLQAFCQLTSLTGLTRGSLWWSTDCIVTNGMERCCWPALEPSDLLARVSLSGCIDSHCRHGACWNWNWNQKLEGENKKLGLRDNNLGFYQDPSSWWLRETSWCSCTERAIEINELINFANGRRPHEWVSALLCTARLSKKTEDFNEFFLVVVTEGGVEQRQTRRRYRKVKRGLRLGLLVAKLMGNCERCLQSNVFGKAAAVFARTHPAGTRNSWKSMKRARCITKTWTLSCVCQTWFIQETGCEKLIFQLKPWVSWCSFSVFTHDHTYPWRHILQAYCTSRLCREQNTEHRGKKQSGQ